MRSKLNALTPNTTIAYIECMPRMWGREGKPDKPVAWLVVSLNEAETTRPPQRYAGEKPD